MATAVKCFSQEKRTLDNAVYSTIKDLQFKNLCMTKAQFDHKKVSLTYFFLVTYPPKN